MRRKLVPTGNLSREEWLELRRSGIGGSDASVIMGKNPYRSILQLWEEKTGKAPITEAGNEAAYWGNVMEPIVRKEFTRRTELKVRQKHFMIFHPEIPYMFADVDGDKGIIGLSQMTCGYAAGHMDLVLFISGDGKGGAEQFNTSIFHKPDCLIAQ